MPDWLRVSGVMRALSLIGGREEGALGMLSGGESGTKERRGWMCESACVFVAWGGVFT